MGDSGKVYFSTLKYLKPQKVLISLKPKSTANLWKNTKLKLV